MSNLIFIVVLGLAYAAVVWWGARHLPGERWQMAAAIPLSKSADGRWRGINITFYGILMASALTASAGLLVVLMGSLGIRGSQVFFFAAPLLLICIPASRLIAGWVESKPATLTIGGASFAGLVLAPWLVLLLRALLPEPAAGLQPAPVLAALASCYALGEGMGRLACLSFGCCYGRPMAESPAWVRLLCGARPLVFSGDLKKVAYEGHMAGRPVVPVQVITSTVYGLAGLAGVYLFMTGWHRASLLLAVAVSGLWRAYSETLRADFRGNRLFTPYQAMALAGIAYSALICLVLPPQDMPPASLSLGLALLWTPAALISLQALWAAVVAFSGLSKVTASTIEFHLLRHRI